MASNSDLSLREARAIYFAANSIPPDGRYGDRWVHVRIGPIPFAFPNTAGRRRIVAAHDLHHALTDSRRCPPTSQLSSTASPK